MPILKLKIPLCSYTTEFSPKPFIINIPQCLNIMDIIYRYLKLFMAHKHHKNRPHIIKI